MPPLQREIDFMAEELADITDRYREHNYEYDVFEKLSDVLRAIKGKEIIENDNRIDVDISERITEPNYRFVTCDSPFLSQETSEALATAIEIGKTLGVRDEKSQDVRAHIRSIEVRRKKADEFALKMKVQIDQLKSEENISTYRDIVDVLNDRGIPTAHEGGRWHLKTLQDVIKRAETLEKSGHSR